MDTTLAQNIVLAICLDDSIRNQPLHPHTVNAVITWSRIVRLQVKSDGSVFDPAVQSSIVEQIKQNLKEKGMLENTTVTWRVQPDGNIFHKITDGL
ncbi:hypothetical protein KOW79_022735 [Hemibagrus wyckioides]|uniref:Uncharacterized protein n=1 Tax=Hemibagrus wyckioides TaxID=337641 RepID=A0A9D3SCZ8_9TELE|nr:hypothetical protein KOW79_022735 [Hemibagrus wyckioides]